MANEAYALDIETDGTVEPLPTAFTLFGEGNAVCVVRESDHEANADAVLREVTDTFHDFDVGIDMTLVTEDWDEMAIEIMSILSEVQDSDRLVTYNGLAYKGGFDIPVLDYAFHQTDVENPLSGLQHIDVYDPVDRGYVYNTVPQFPKRGGPKKTELRAFAEEKGYEDEASGLNKAPLADLLNTNLSADEIQAWAEANDRDVPTTDDGSLDGVYDYLYDTEYPDPFEDSVEAVEAWENGYYSEVLVHNITDTVKTMRVYEYIEESAIPYKNYAPERLG